MQASSVAPWSQTYRTRSLLLSYVSLPRTHQPVDPWVGSFLLFLECNLVREADVAGETTLVGDHLSVPVWGLCLVQRNLSPGDDLQRTKGVCSVPAWAWLSVVSRCRLGPWGLERSWLHAGLDRLWASGKAASFLCDRQLLFMWSVCVYLEKITQK